MSEKTGTTREQRDAARDALDGGTSCSGAIMSMDRPEPIEDTLRLLLDEVEEGEKSFRTMGHLGDSCGRLLKRAEAAEEEVARADYATRRAVERAAAAEAKLRRIQEIVGADDFSDKAACLQALGDIAEIVEGADGR